MEEFLLKHVAPDLTAFNGVMVAILLLGWREMVALRGTLTGMLERLLADKLQPDK